MIRFLSSVRTPLLLRIFLVMLASAGAVQLISVVLLFVLPAPVPRLFSIDQVSASLKTGSDANGELRVSTRPPAAEVRQGPRAVHMRNLFAERLGVPDSRVSVQLLVEPRMPPRFGAGGAMSKGVPPFPGPPGKGFGGSSDELLFGDFAVSLQLQDGSWRTVQPVRGFASFWRWRALSWMLAALLAIAPFAWWLARRIARPIAAFASAAERLGRDPRSAPLPVRGPPEIEEAAAAFNQMQARLSRYIEDRSMLLAAIAHDLRTPLARIAFRMENAPEPLRAATEGDIKDMEAMLASTLALVRDMTVPPKRQRLDLRAVMESVTDSFSDNGADVRLMEGGAAIVEGDRAELKRLFGNLIRNANLYGGQAEVALGTSETEIWVEVRDNGPGIPEELLDRVFEPFFRVEQSRNRESGGMGLGLASARAIARAHGGELTLRNRSEGGLIARVSLPIFSSPA